MTRFALRTATVAIGVAAATASVVVRQEECRGAGVRCAGAEGFPFVEYDMCCEGLSCAGFSTSGDYGTFCVDVANPGDFVLTPVDAATSEPATVVPNTGGTTETEDAPEEAPAVGADGASEAPSTTAAAAGEDDLAAEDDVAVEDDVAAGGVDVEDGAAEGVTGAPVTTETTEDGEDGDDTTVVGGVAADTAEESSEEDDADDTTGAGIDATETPEDDDTDTIASVTVDPLAEATDDEIAEASIDEDGNVIFPDGRASASDEEDDDDDDSVCFPGSATVELQNGGVVPMSSLSIGDMVKVGVNEYSRVFMFTHKMADAAYKFVTLETESGAALSLTDGHYLYANGALVAAKTVKAGDTLTLGNGEESVVSAVGTTADVGLFNPQTVSGNVVVNGVVASTYTTAVEPGFAHAILSPFRLMNYLGFQFTALESGGGVLAEVAPRGQAAF